MNFQPKVRQLEQIKIDFDDNGGELPLPKMINSKKQFDNGPSNNKRFKVPLKKAFGFVQPEESSNESCTSENPNLGTKIFGKKIKETGEHGLLGKLVKDPICMANKLREVLQAKRNTTSSDSLAASINQQK